MFYLKYFFKILIKSPGRGVSLIIFSLLLVFSLGQRPFLEEQFTKLIPENKAGASFFALMSSTEPYQKIASQMTALPGVYKVEVLNEAQIKDEVKSILNTMQVDVKNNLIDLSYVGLKIIYNKDVRPRGQELIRDYLTHLAQEGNITLGAIKSTDALFEKRNLLISNIKEWGYTAYLTLLVVFWGISLLLVRSKIVEASYLLESYQRRNKVGLKMAINGLIFLFICSALMTFSLGMPRFVNLGVAFILFFLGGLLHMKKAEWEN